MSVLDDHIAALCANAAPRVCVEIGSGSGIVSAHLSNLIRYHSARRPIIFATDVNEKAAEATSKTFAKFGRWVESSRGAVLNGSAQECRSRRGHRDRSGVRARTTAVSSRRCPRVQPAVRAVAGVRVAQARPDGGMGRWHQRRRGTWGCSNANWQ